MVYQGSKARFKKILKPIIETELQSINAKVYCEPFVGGANMITYIDWPVRVGYDINDALIAFLQQMQQVERFEFSPISREEYSILRKQHKEKNIVQPLWYYGFVMTCWSFCGKNWASFGEQKSEEENGNYRNIKLRINNVNRQIQQPNFKNIIFKCCNYKNIPPMNDCVYYLDPPYDQKRKHYNIKFNADEFLNWIEEMSKITKNSVFLLSEYKELPSDKWAILWHQETQDGLLCRTSKKKQEYLYKYIG